MPNVTPLPIAQLATDRQMSTVRFSRCGKFLAAAGRDGTLRLWNATPLESLPLGTPPAEAPPPVGNKPTNPAKLDIKLPELPAISGHNGWVTSLAFHPTEDLLFSADSWGTLAAWKYGERETNPVWRIDSAHEGWIRQLALSPDGTQLATCGSDQMIRLWTTKDGTRSHEIPTGEDVFSLAYHPEGKFLVSGDLKGVIQQWDLTTHSSVRKFDASLLYMLSFIQDVGGVRCLAFDTTGTTLAATGTQPTGGGFVQGSPVVRFFDWTSGLETKTLKPGDNTEGFVHEFAFHPQGYWIGVCSGQPGKGKYFLLNPSEEQAYFSSQGLANCHALAVHPHGTRLAVIANVGTFGQSRSKAREGIYPGNTSPIHIFALETPV